MKSSCNSVLKKDLDVAWNHCAMFIPWEWVILSILSWTKEKEKEEKEEKEKAQGSESSKKLPSIWCVCDVGFWCNMGKGRQLGGHDAKDWSKDFRIYRSQSCHCFDFNSKVPILIKFFLIVSMWPGNSEKDTKDAKEMKEDLVTWLWRGCFANCQGDLPRFRCCFGRGCWEATSRKIHSRKVCQAQGETTRSVSVKYFTSDFLRAWTPGGCVEIPATWKMKVKKSYLSIAFHCTLEPGTCPWLAWLLMTPPCVCETKCFFSCVWSEFGSHTGHFDVFCFMWLLAEALKVWEGTVPVAKETWFMHGFKSGSPANISSVYHSQWSCHGFMPIEVNKNTLSVLNCIIRYYSYIRTHTCIYIYICTHTYMDMQFKSHDIYVHI